MPEQLTEEQVRRVAKLARLTLTDDEVRDCAGKLSDIVEYVSKLSELHVEGVEPMAHAMDVTNVLREDTSADGMPVDDVLANAPQASPPFFKVIKVLGDASGA
ncbi:MAG: Asp-tRNA(Asn)/Glu-tRNA(Gln) amidotransferase GatCAB subunit C [Phycisphaerae bacterium]|jgi:aspartyl-tRNA(Asn)/glutamyl-tRNA(Gln) amidotransferase subunit C|nr:Asp-tRNA(Asn)/Glu-tRNA(Gln) amidotransferase GatCAB subunit C [Phycisphaerae bacterium]MDP6152363.1 Asp-tRNA(Asn)/Glu-tRNA(Gln) amidotransferase subunit GatC [Phycisphaeraceae bacterium]MDP7348064.1 Asp-tRNA(Asn)/Glu-tRNA(Gln) amidotransferase subunit GatC [Phycisphaeraceae bacterium]